MLYVSTDKSLRFIWLWSALFLFLLFCFVLFCLCFVWLCFSFLIVVVAVIVRCAQLCVHGKCIDVFLCKRVVYVCAWQQLWCTLLHCASDTSAQCKVQWKLRSQTWMRTAIPRQTHTDTKKANSNIRVRKVCFFGSSTAKGAFVFNINSYENRAIFCVYIETTTSAPAITIKEKTRAHFPECVSVCERGFFVITKRQREKNLAHSESLFISDNAPTVYTTYTSDTELVCTVHFPSHVWPK